MIEEFSNPGLPPQHRKMSRHGKPKVVVTTAIAREMVGFIWAIARIAQPALDLD
jgi:hypothetical protein